MRFRNTIILGILFVGLAGYVYLAEIRGGERREADAEKATRLLPLDRNTVEELILSSPEVTVHCLRDTTGRWHLLEPLVTEGSEEAIDRLLGSLEEATVQRTVADSAENLSDYGLDRPRLTVRIKQTGRDQAEVIRLGDQNPTGSFVYASRDSGPEILLVSSSLYASLDKKAFDLRFRKVLDIDRDEVRRISISRRGEAIACAKVLDQWRLEQPIQARADGDRIETMIRELAEADVEAFVEEEGGQVARYGLDRPELSVQLLVGESGALKRLDIGRREQGTYYARDASRRPVFTVDSSLVAVLDKDAAALRDRKVMALKPLKVHRLRLASGGFDLLGEKDSTGVWHIIQPLQCRGDESKIRELLWDLEGLKAETFVSDDPGPLEPYGLSEPRARLEIWMEGDSTAQTLLAGRAVDGKVYVKNTLSPSIYLVEAGFLDKMGKDVTSYRDKRILNFYSYQVRSFEIARQGDRWVWKRTSEGDWKGPSGGRAELASISGFLSDLQGLEAEGFVEDDPGDLSHYGLAEPSYTITLRFADRPPQTLLVGTVQDERVYVMNRDRRSVCLAAAHFVETVRKMTSGEEEKA